MCVRSLVKLAYCERRAEWCKPYVNASLSQTKTAQKVDCSAFTTAMKGCRPVQLSPNLVNFYRENELVGQTVWQEQEGDSELQFRLLTAH